MGGGGQDVCIRGWDGSPALAEGVQMDQVEQCRYTSRRSPKRKM